MNKYDFSESFELDDYLMLEIFDDTKLVHVEIHIEHTNLYYGTFSTQSHLMYLAVEHNNQILMQPLHLVRSSLTKEETVETVKNTYEYLRLKYSA